MNKQLSDIPPRCPLLIVISGPAGVGKDAVVKRLKERGCPFHFVVTATDRAPRPGEVHGRDYFFYSTEIFQQMEQDGELLEHALVYGQHKGVPKQQVREAMASGQDVVMRVDVQGAATVRAMAPEAVLIFLHASPEELIRRMTRRGTDSPEQIALRSEQLATEMACLDIFDYVIANREGGLDRAVEQVISIIEAEHCRVQPREVKL